MSGRFIRTYLRGYGLKGTTDDILRIHRGDWHAV